VRIRGSVLRLAVSSLLLTVSAGCRETERPFGLLISNVHVFDAETGTFSEPSAILIRGEEIHSVGLPDELAKPEQIIDGGGAFALPGLWDSHVHLSAMTLASNDSVRTHLESYVRQGVLYVRDVGGQLEALARLEDRVASGEFLGPEIYFAGPLAERPPLRWEAFNEEQPGYTVPIETESQVDSLVATVARAGGTHVKAFRNWDPDLFRRLVRRAHSAGLKVVVDPGRPFFPDIPIDSVLALGVTSIEHAYSPWQAVLPAGLMERRDSLTSEADGDARRAFRQETVMLGVEAIDVEALRALGDRMVEADAYFCPTLTVWEDNRDGGPIPGLTSEEATRLWNGLADASSAMTRVLAERGVTFLTGSDEDDPLGVAREMEVLVAAGVDPAHVLQAATLHPARWIGEETEIGSLAAGKRADIVVVAGDPLLEMSVIRNPVLVIQNGTVRHREGLDPQPGR
jgi:imidazolonepropionase-like amidohydrolase